MTAFATFQLPDGATKLRFKEPYVSEAANLKDAGVTPPGVYRGYTPSPQPGFLLNFNVDATSLDSVAVVETPQHYNMTVRSDVQISIDMTGQVVFPVLAVLRTEYGITPSPLAGFTFSRVLVVSPTVNNANPQNLHTGDVKLCRIVGFIGTIPNTSTAPVTDRQDNGGPLVTSNQLSSSGTQYTEVEDVVSGVFVTGAGYPAFSPIPSPVGAFVQGGTGPSDVVVHVTAQSDAGSSLFFIDTSILGIDLDAGPIRVVGSTSNLGLGDGRGANIGGSIKFPAVPPGPHTFNLHLSQTSFSSAVKRDAAHPLRMVIFHK
jgi:hypothetical protein